MSIIIMNSGSNDPMGKLHRYVVRVNQKIICEFDHERMPGGLAQCLRDAAEAVDMARRVEMDGLLLKLERGIAESNLNELGRDDDDDDAQASG